MFARLSDKQKKILLAVGAAGALALITLLGRGRGGGSTAPDAAELGAEAASTPGMPSTFADNGEAAAGLSTALTEGLASVGTALASQPAPATATEIAAALPQQASSEEIAAAVLSQLPQPTAASAESGGPAATTQTARRRSSSRATNGRTPPNVHEQTSGTRAGLRFKTTVKRGKVVRLYESEGGKGDYGKARGSRLAVRAASTPKPKARLPKPKPKPKAKPKPSPSRPSARAKTPPTRRKSKSRR